MISAPGGRRDWDTRAASCPNPWYIHPLFATHLARRNRLAAACADAAEAGESADALEHRYATLRAEALALNARHGRATREEFGAQFPTIDGLSVIEALDGAVEQRSGVPDRVEQRNDRLIQLLRDLAGWATGVRTAYDTLDDFRGG